MYNLHKILACTPLKFIVSSQSKQAYTHICIAVTLMWGLVWLTPIIHQSLVTKYTKSSIKTGINICVIDVEQSTAHITLTQTDPAFNYKCIPYLFSSMQSFTCNIVLYVCRTHSCVRLKTISCRLMKECV